jgi:hypothetical protein
VTAFVLLLGPSCYIRFYHIEIVSDYVLACAGCNLNTGFSCVKAVAEMRGVCSYLSLENE